MQLFKNNAYSATVGATTDVATTINLAAGTGARFPNPGAGEHFLLTLADLSGGSESAWEIVKVTARATDALTVVRGQEGTVARAWNAGTPVELRLTAGTADQSNLAEVATVAGTDVLPLARGGIVKATIQKVLDWIKTQAITWAAKQTFSADIEFAAGAGRKILGDFSGAANVRTIVQTSAANDSTALLLVPSGTGTTAALQLANNSSLTNYSVGIFRTTATSVDVLAQAVGTGSFLPVVLWTSGIARFTVTVAGNIEIPNFTKLGESATPVKVKELSGTANGSAGGTVSIAHGLTHSKIVGVQAIVGSLSGNRLLPGSPVAANAYQVHFDGTYVIVTNGASSGANINGQPVTLLVTYKE